MEQESRAITRTDWLLIGALVLLVLPLRCWLLYNTEVTARDSIGYIRYALQFEHLPWDKVCKDNHQHPGYPICVYLMSLPVRAVDGDRTTPENMELSTQLVSLFASLVLLLPMYFLGRQFFDRTVSFGGTLLFQYLPVSAQHLSDGISEPTYLVFLVSGLLFMVQAIRDRNVWSCVACGAFAGLAYLVRPEGLLIVPAFGLALLLAQCLPEWRSSRGRFLACGVAMVLAAMLVGSIYVYATGRITNKLSAIETLNNLKKWFVTPKNAAGGGSMQLLAVTFLPQESKAMRCCQSFMAFAKELLQGLHYVGLVPALLGLWWTFPMLRRHAGFWALAIYALMHSFILIALGMSVFYVSDRHVMILVLLSSFFVVVGLRELATRVVSWFNVAELKWYYSAQVWFAILFVALIGASMPRATQRLHGMRVGNHEAGKWLAEHVDKVDVIEDDHAWSHFFSGLLFQEGKEPPVSRDQHPKCYIVATRARDGSDDPKRISPLLTKDADPVYTWPEKSEPSRARVVVYAQPRNAKTHPWREAP